MVDGLNLRFERRKFLGINGALIHARRIVIANFLGHGASVGEWLGGFFQYAAQDEQILILQFG